MKIKYLAAGFTLFMVFIMLHLGRQLQSGEQAAIDMVYYNGERKEISKAVLAGMDKENVKAQFDCSLLFLTDQDYSLLLNDALTNGYIVLDYEENGIITGKLIWDRESRMYESWKKDVIRNVLVVCLLLLVLGYGLLWSIYIYYIRPFKSLKSFSAEIAKGNLDIPLPMHRHNFFGAFTESFDIMREELKRAKENEYLANRSKKELVAELSHDIKTPVASIKAACEVMEVKETGEDTLKKVRIIATKADTIDRLVNNLFHATMEELEVLKTDVREESSLLIPQMFENLKCYGDIFQNVKICEENTIPSCLLYMDKLRLEQVIDNLINNSCKYAKTPIFIRYQDKEEGITVTIKDRGPGMPKEELILAEEKFYRGSNAKGQAGSGLGLYLAKCFMEQMQGGMECSVDQGFVVTLFLGKV